MRTGAPVTWLGYNAWQYGPVAEDIYYSKNAGHNKFSRYVNFNHAGGNKYIVKPIVEFSDAEFSDTDLSIANEVLEKYGRKSTRDLIRRSFEGRT